MYKIYYHKDEIEFVKYYDDPFGDMDKYDDMNIQYSISVSQESEISTYKEANILSYDMCSLIILAQEYFSGTTE